MHAISARHDASQVTAVIPALNEAPSVGDVVLRCLPVVGSVIVVDGGSTDGTPDIAGRHGARVLQDHGRGKGDALRCAIPHVETAIVVFLDADGSHAPEDIPRLVAPIVNDEADHVSASRLLGGSSELHGGFDEFCRLAGSSFITACINYRFNLRLSDSQNGFRAIRTSTLRHLRLVEDRTTIEQELIIRTIRGGFRLAEVASHEYPRRHGESHVKVPRVAARYLFSLVRHLYF